ncbi:MAG TPA: ribonuclease Z [Ferruginibacter sp.]|nr:ribonuclease Z [Ferruginibacter sp.]
MLTVTILGNNSALPAYGRNPTAQVLQTPEESFLIDCGEGTQVRLLQYKIKTSRISHIFISHLHGDHYFGLIALLSSMALQNRQQPVHLHAPAALEKLIQLQLDVAEATLSFPLHFHALEQAEIIADTPTVTVSCFPMQHRIPCWGFVFTEKKNLRKIDPVRVQSYGVPPTYYNRLQQGEDYIHPKGTIVPNSELTIEAEPPKRYAYCGDTLYTEDILEHIRGVDLLYHETTYLKDFGPKAEKYFHSTTEQAGRIAQQCGAGRLLIGHFSSKYETLECYLEETRAVFPQTELAIEGACFKV